MVSVEIRERFYARLEDVREELKRRASLRPTVEAWLAQQGVSVPSPLVKSPRAFFARQVATFRYEDAVFAVQAEHAGLDPLWLSYTGDRMVSLSPLKRSYAHPRFIMRIGRNGGIECETKRLVNIVECDGTPLSNIVCVNGNGPESLIDFHGTRLRKLYPHSEVFDITATNRTLGGRPTRYYPAFLALAVAHGVLFEDYHGGESGDNLPGFTTEIFEPAFMAVEKLFGVKPLVVPMPWWPELALYPSLELNRMLHWRFHAFAMGNLTRVFMPPPYL